MEPTLGSTPAMPSPESLGGLPIAQCAPTTPVPMMSRKSSFSSSSDDSESSRSDSPKQKLTLETLVTNIDLLVQALDEVNSLRVSSQQKRRALLQSRDNVARKDEALASVMRKLRAERTTFEDNNIATLSDNSLQARDELGPLEDDFGAIEYQLVPKEHVLKEKGKEIKRQWQALRVEWDGSSVSKHENNDSHTSHFSPTEAGISTSFPERGKKPLHLSKESLLQLSRPQDEYRTTLRAHGTTQSEPLVRQYAPDLFFDSPWTAIGKPWIPISYVDDEPAPKLVTEEDLSDLGMAKTDTSDKGNELLLDNEPTTRCPFLRELSPNDHIPYGRRVSQWLLCSLRKSRLEVLRLRLIMDLETKEWNWVDILRFWDSDAAARAKTPSDSEDMYYTNVREDVRPPQISLYQSVSAVHPIVNFSPKKFLPAIGSQFSRSRSASHQAKTPKMAFAKARYPRST
jgi:hypothetical protein